MFLPESELALSVVLSCEDSRQDQRTALETQLGRLRAGTSDTLNITGAHVDG